MLGGMRVSTRWRTPGPCRDSDTDGVPERQGVGAALPELYDMREGTAVDAACLTGPEKEDVVWLSSQLMFSEANRTFRELAAREWITPTTSSIDVKVPLYNGELGTFAMVEMTVEQSLAGDVRIFTKL